MNQDQFLGMLKIAVPSIISYAVGKGLIPAGASGDVATAILTLAAMGWSWAAHTNSAKIASVTALPDVSKVVVSASAPINSAASNAAADSNQPKVTRASSDPSQPRSSKP
jgi:hypothetical protein